MAKPIPEVQGEKEGEPVTRLSCTNCDEHTVPVREEDDPETVVRCEDCGKKHSTASTTVIKWWHR